MTGVQENYLDSESTTSLGRPSTLTTDINTTTDDQMETNGKDNDPIQTTIKNTSKESLKHTHEELSTENNNNNHTSKQSKRRKKVGSACVYCRRSHMNCDDSRPCKRCVKRNIGHLCHDDPKSNSPAPASIPESTSTKAPTPATTLINSKQEKQPQNYSSIQSTFLHPSAGTLNQQPFFYSEHAGSEFNSLTEFLSMIDDNDMMDSINLTNDPLLQKLEATNYINGLSSSSANLQNMLHNNNNNNNNNNQNYRGNNSYNSQPEWAF